MVTAQRRKEASRDVPISITTIGTATRTMLYDWFKDFGVSVDWSQGVELDGDCLRVQDRHPSAVPGEPR